MTPSDAPSRRSAARAMIERPRGSGEPLTGTIIILFKWRGDALAQSTQCYNITKRSVNRLRVCAFDSPAALFSSQNLDSGLETNTFHHSLE
jgi:hypothetical protein